MDTYRKGSKPTIFNLKVQPETNKVLVNVHNDKTGKYHQRLLDVDGLYQLDNQPELFNERRIVRKKFL